MNYELSTYRQFFDRAMDSNSAKTVSIEELESDIKLESMRMLMSMQINIANLSPSRARQYTLQHQQAFHIILAEIDNVLASDDAKMKGKHNQQILAIFRSTSENLLLELQKYFPFHFNDQSEMPSHLQKTIQADIEEKANYIIGALIEMNSQDEALKQLKCAIYPILTEHHNITYAQGSYLEAFLKKLTAKIEQVPNPIGPMDILLHMVSSNYNHPLFYEFCCEYIRREVDRCEELSAQYSTLNFIKKCIKQTSLPDDAQYSPKGPRIKESLIKYIKSELQYLQSMDNIGAHLHQHGLLDERYKVTFTVKQLAIFIHIQVEAKIIIAETPKLLHDHIVKHYSTNETERISAKSFKNAYYSASTDDLEKVIDKIVTMLAIAQEKL